MSEEQEAQKPRRVEITERDIAVLTWIGEQYAAERSQIQRLLGQQAGGATQQAGILSDSATRVWLKRMHTMNLIEEEKLFRKYGPFTWLTPAGLRLAGLDFKPLKPQPTTLQHHYWCNQVRLYLAEKRPGYVWKSERYLRSEHAQATRDQRQAPDLPDAHFTGPNGEIAIEVELTDKQQTRLEGIVRRRASVYYTVWYFCSQETKRRVEAARDKLPQEIKECVSIYDLPE